MFQFGYPVFVIGEVADGVAKGQRLLYVKATDAATKAVCLFTEQFHAERARDAARPGWEIVALETPAELLLFLETVIRENQRDSDTEKVAYVAFDAPAESAGRRPATWFCDIHDFIADVRSRKG